MQRMDIQHHTPEEVRRYLSAALVMVEDIDAPDDLRAVVFTQAATMLASKSVQLQAAQPVMMPSMAIPQGRRQ